MRLTHGFILATQMDDIKKDDLHAEEQLQKVDEVAPGTQNDDVPPPPDGGLEAWMQVLGSWCLVFNTMG